MSKGIIFRSLIDAGKFSWYHAYFDTVAAKDERGRHFIEVNIFKAIQMYQSFQANQVCLWNFFVLRQYSFVRYSNVFFLFSFLIAGLGTDVTCTWKNKIPLPIILSTC